MLPLPEVHSNSVLLLIAQALGQSLVEQVREFGYSSTDGASLPPPTGGITRHRRQRIRCAAVPPPL